MPDKKHNKQHDARAASFKRIAKGLRSVPWDLESKAFWKKVAKVFDDEANLLRSMR